MSDKLFPPNDNDNGDNLPPDDNHPHASDANDGQYDPTPEQMSAEKQFIEMINAQRRAAQLKTLRDDVLKPFDEPETVHQNQAEDPLANILNKLPEEDTYIPAWLPAEGDAVPEDTIPSIEEDNPEDYLPSEEDLNLFRELAAERPPRPIRPTPAKEEPVPEETPPFEDMDSELEETPQVTEEVWLEEETIDPDWLPLSDQFNPESSSLVWDEEDETIDPLMDDEVPAFEIEDDPQFIPTRRAQHQQPPRPSEQSTFVNPVVARISSAARSVIQPTNEPSELWLMFRTIVIVITAALTAAFILNYWTPDSFLSEEFVGGLQAVSSTQGPPTAIPTPIPTFQSVKKVGILIGHSGHSIDPNFEIDPGAVCDDNNDGTPELTELSINTAVGQRVAALLTGDYEVEVLEEFDERLQGYRADALVSIHTNTCQQFFEGGATGFNVEPNGRNPSTIDRDSRLADCIVTDYAARTALPRHFGRPPDLVDYHVFRKVSVDTPTVIVELGFMFENRAVLVGQPDDMAAGIAEGVRCFLDNINQFVPTEAAPSG